MQLQDFINRLEKSVVGKKFKTKLSLKELSVMCLQFYIVLKAGITIDDGISAIEESLEDKYLKKVTQNLAVQIDKSLSFSEAIKNCGCFPDYMVNMIEIGERSGNLDKVCFSLSDYYDRENMLRNNIRTAVMYPSLLIAMITAVMGILVVKVLPLLSKVIKSLEGDISESSYTAINIGEAIGKYSFYIVLIILIIAAILWLIGRNAKGKQMLYNIADKIPFIHKINTKISSARFSSVMSMLIESGYDTNEALNLVLGILPTKDSIKKAKACKESIENGVPFGEAVKQAGIFTGLYPSMIKMGVKTGTLDSVMKSISYNCDDDAQSSLTNAVSYIEPVLVGFLSIIIGCVLLSNLLPLLGVISSVG